MRGIFFPGDGEIQIRDIDRVDPGKGEVVLAMKASGICGSDLAPLRMKAAMKGNPSDLKVVGHEPCGIVSEIGPGVDGLELGDRVMMHHYTGCNRCNMCEMGYTQMCLVHHEIYGSTMDGGHQDFLVVPASTCIHMPEGLDFASGAACACGTGTAFHALKRLSLNASETLVVFGQGPVGLSVTMFAAQMGIRVIAIDVVPERLDLSRALGADAVIDSSTQNAEQTIRELTKGLGSDGVLDATGIPQVRLQAVDSVKSWGKVCFVGEGNETTFDISRQIIHKQLTIYGSWTFSRAGLEEVSRFVVDQKSPMEKLITHTFDIGEAKKAYDLFIGGTTGKVVFTWE